MMIESGCILSQQYPPGTQEKYNSFQKKIPMMKDGMKTVVNERWGGVWKSEGFPMKGLESFRNPEDFEEAGFGRPGVPTIYTPREINFCELSLNPSL